VELSKTLGTPPTLVATTGVPAAMASKTTMGIPSERELSTEVSKAAKRRPAS
jgi:hypothetical protein